MFESVVDRTCEILRVKASEQYLLPWGTVYYILQGGSSFWVSGWNPITIQKEAPVVLFIMLYLRLF